MKEPDRLGRFEQAVLPHLDSAYNLARWLVPNGHDAEDLVQEACLRAVKSFDGFRGGGDARAWLLTTVRNSCYNCYSKAVCRSSPRLSTKKSTRRKSSRGVRRPRCFRVRDARLVGDALEELPPEFREAIVLRELEGMSYKEIARLCGIPVGTVMSRLARARQRLERYFVGSVNKESCRDLPGK